MQTATVYSDISFRLQGTVGILSLIHILLLHKQEIRKIQSTLMEKGLTLIPLKLYLDVYKRQIISSFAFFHRILLK